MSFHYVSIEQFRCINRQSKCHLSLLNIITGRNTNVSEGTKLIPDSMEENDLE